MKSSFQLLAMTVLAVILCVSSIGCDSSENADQIVILPSEMISDSELEKAAEADIVIYELKYQLYLDALELEGGPGYNAVYKLWLESRRKRTEALERIGIDFETYNDIMAQVRLNEEVGKRFQEKVQSIQQNGTAS